MSGFPSFPSSMMMNPMAGMVPVGMNSVVPPPAPPGMNVGGFGAFPAGLPPGVVPPGMGDASQMRSPPSRFEKGNILAFIPDLLFPVFVVHFLYTFLRFSLRTLIFLVSCYFVP